MRDLEKTSAKRIPTVKGLMAHRDAVRVRRETWAKVHAEMLVLRRDRCMMQFAGVGIPLSIVQKVGIHGRDGAELFKSRQTQTRRRCDEGRRSRVSMCRR